MDPIELQRASDEEVLEQIRDAFSIVRDELPEVLPDLKSLYETGQPNTEPLGSIAHHLVALNDAIEEMLRRNARGESKQ